MEPANTSGKKRPRRISRPTLFPVALISIAILFSPTGTWANDSIAALGAGGIELTKTEHIRALEEVLEISTKKVRVKYRFLNESEKDIHTTVAFPFPSYNLRSLIYEPSANTSEMVSETFKVVVDGREIPTKLERKAVLAGRDITDQLRKSGLSDKEIFFEVTVKDADPLSERLDKFRVRFGDFWNVSQTAFWDMTFPSGKQIVIEHEYVPAAGGGYCPWPDLYGKDSAERFKKAQELWSSFTGKRDKDEDCIDERTKRAIENRAQMAISKGLQSVMVYYDNVKYILGTGRNWKGPIGEFKLRLIKDKPTHFVSVCFPGKPEKISPTVYEFTQKDFVPQDTLAVYFYRVERN